MKESTEFQPVKLMDTITINNKTNWDTIQDPHYYGEGIKIYEFEFMDNKEIQNFYQYILDNFEIIQKNFGGDPLEQNSFIVFNMNGIEYTINPPIASTGDREWYHSAYIKDVKTINVLTSSTN